MGNRNLYYFFIFAVYWVKTMITDVLNLLFVLPYRILLFTPFMGISDAAQFIRAETQTSLNRMRVHGLSFRLALRDGKPSVTIRTYSEEADALTEELRKKHHKSTRSLIEDALLTVRKCSFVILEENDTGMRFIQFHRNAGTYYFDFPLTPLTLNRDYATEIIQLLRERGFRKNKRVIGYAFRYKTYAINTIRDDLTSINAEFGNDLELAVDTSTYIFEKVFGFRQVPTAVFG